MQLGERPRYGWFWLLVSGLIMAGMLVPMLHHHESGEFGTCDVCELGRGFVAVAVIVAGSILHPVMLGAVGQPSVRSLRVLATALTPLRAPPVVF